MDSTTIPFTIQLSEELCFVFSPQALVERLQILSDKRKARGTAIRWPCCWWWLCWLAWRVRAGSNRWPIGPGCGPPIWPSCLGRYEPGCRISAPWSPVFAHAVDVEELEQILGSSSSRSRQARRYRSAAASCCPLTARFCAAPFPKATLTGCIWLPPICPTRAWRSRTSRSSIRQMRLLLCPSCLGTSL